jgi:Glycosyl hydrolases family 15
VDSPRRQHYATDAPDASTLLAAILGFLPAGDVRLRSSVLAIADNLTEQGFVLRYRTGETDDGLSGKEGTFLICSFWLVSAPGWSLRFRPSARSSAHWLRRPATTETDIRWSSQFEQ